VLLSSEERLSLGAQAVFEAFILPLTKSMYHPRTCFTSELQYKLVQVQILFLLIEAPVVATDERGTEAKSEYAVSMNLTQFFQKLFLSIAIFNNLYKKFLYYSNIRCNQCTCRACGGYFINCGIL
jgi:hypothetical protein